MGSGGEEIGCPVAMVLAAIVAAAVVISVSTVVSGHCVGVMQPAPPAGVSAVGGDDDPVAASAAAAAIALLWSSAVCVRWCFLRLARCENDFWQTVHVNGFSPVWMRSWLFRCARWANDFEHVGQV